MNKVVSVKNVSFSYKDKNVFSNIDIDVEKNTINSIIGSNNSGKTTLIRILSGVLPFNGEIRINDVLVNKKTARKTLLNIGIAFSNIEEQFLFSNVLDELRFPLENLMFNERDIRNRIQELSSITGIDYLFGSKVKNLTNYEKILVLISVSTIHKPKLLFIDDIFVNLSSEEKKDLFLIFRKLIKEWDLTIVFTTSDLRISALSDMIFVIDNGKICLRGPFSEVIEKDNEISKLGIIVPLDMDICLKLKFYNLIDGIYSNIDEVVDKLWP